MSNLSIEQQIEKLKTKSFCPVENKKIIFDSCGGVFCSRLCNVRKNWNELENEYKENLIKKVKTEYYKIN